MRRCPVCNTDYPDATRFCVNDGSTLVEVPTSARQEAVAPKFKLIIQEPDVPRRQYYFSSVSTTIGKSNDNVLVLADVTVSRHHATITRDGNRFRISDAGSRNGVFVNRARIGQTGYVLEPADVITIGKTSLTFWADEPDLAAQQQAITPTNKEEIPEQQPEGHIEILLPTGETVRVAISSDDISIGRADDCKVTIPDPTVSRQQALLQRRGKKWHLTNIGRNTVLVNGKITPPEGVEITAGDVVEIGKSRLTLFPDQPTVSPRTIRTEGVGNRQVPGLDAAPPPAPPPTPPPIPQEGGASAYRVRNTGELAPVAPAEAKRDRPVSASRIVLDGRYEIESKIGQSSTGTVYRARRLFLGDYVAVKVLRPELVRDDMTLKRFQREAQVAARIKHPNSVQIFDFGSTSEGAVYYVKELLSGRTLRDLVQQERGLSLPRIVGIFNQICGAVHTAHQNGIVLRDIKPESIYVERGADGREVIKVGGYGLAKLDAASSGGVTMAGQAKLFGTPQYVSPEQWMDKPLDSRSDVYSLGIILFELLTGAVPFDAPTVALIADMHLNTPAPSLSDFGRWDVDEGVGAIITRALSKDPRQRPASALFLAAELEAVAGAPGKLARTILAKTGLLPMSPIVVQQGPVPVPVGEESLPSVVAEPESTGRGAFNAVVLALMAEAFLSRISSGLVKTTVPLFALLVFGFSITSTMLLVLVQNIVPLVLRPVFGSLADKFGKKRIFMVSLGTRTLVSALYALAISPIFFAAISLIRGISDSAKGPSTSALIADATDEKHIAQAFSWYSTIKSTSGGIGESIAAFVFVLLIGFFVGVRTVPVTVAVTDAKDKKGNPVEKFIKSADVVSPDSTLPGDEKHPEPFNVVRIEERTVSIGDLSIDDMPNVVDPVPLRKAMVAIFMASTLFSLFSMFIVGFLVHEEKKKDKQKKEKSKHKVGATSMLNAPQKQPNVYAYSLLGAALTAPAYMVTGEFFTILAVKLDVTPAALGWIKIAAETAVPLVFGPFFGWLADRIGPGKVIAMRSLANMATSVLFWVTPFFAGTALLGLMMGLARAVDEIGKAAFKPTWGAISAKISSFDVANRSKTMGILEMGVDISDLTFPVLAGVLLEYLSLGWLMLVRAVFAAIAEVYAVVLGRRYKV